MTTPDPIGAPVTVAAVADQLRIGPSDPEYAQLDQPVAAVNALIGSWVDPPVDVDGNPADYPANIAVGGAMLAARLYRRRNSPAGVEAMGDLGPVYVQRNDPDVALLLGLGNHRKPRVG